MKLKTLKDIEVAEKKVLVRADLDVGKNFGGVERLEVLLPTLDFLDKRNAQIVLIGHRGRPGGKVDNSLSMEPVGEKFEKILKEKWGEKRVEEINMHVLENLRFNPGEEANDEHYAEHLAEEGEIYVNEAFATSHRKHASIIGIPKYIPGVCGIRFCEEVENLEKVRDNPRRPLIILISGVKDGKLRYIDKFREFADRILIGGRLSEYLGNNLKDEKIFVSGLSDSKLDIDEDSIKKYKEIISKAGTIVLSGPVSKFEEKEHMQGTKRVFEAVAGSSAFKLAGGGHTRHAISMLNLKEKFDWISVGGGSMLEFLAKGTLPGIEALLN
ncbi:phosphoglycerate kinase [Patescibacteria group bacterium]|nr:phosphoglycerate kinase [Patescibacteria group bacterium]